MATDATGTPSTNFSFPKLNVNVDAPSGLGINAMIDDIDSKLLSRFVQSASAKSANQVPIWNGSNWTWGTIGSANITDGSVATTDLANSSSVRQMLASDGSSIPTWVNGGWQQIGASQISGGATANFSFTSIPQNFRHLKIMLEGLGSGAGSMGYAYIKFNAGGTYYGQAIQASGTVVSAHEWLGSATGEIGFCGGASAVGTLFDNCEITIPIYVDGTRNKYYTSVSGASYNAATASMYSGSWYGVSSITAALTQIDIYPIGNAGTWISGSGCTLYGIS